MLFNAPEFLFAFLPAVLAVYWILGKRGYQRASISWLVAASLFFYAWWKVEFVALLLLSMGFNYGLGHVLGGAPEAKRKPLLTLGVAANLGVLGYYKYANFFLETLERVAGSDFPALDVVLPLGISFFTFQQIAYLVDAARGETREQGFLPYALFVSFFPQLIAGPIVHHKEMLPQFSAESRRRFSSANLAIGATIFVLGLAKKVIVADTFATYASPIFNAAATGVAVTMLEAWTGALAYTLQLYFDFSGYSEMALGGARMFGIWLPLNFHSPYKARNIIDFWRRWHMTLSRFLRDYLYIPLGGNRRGTLRRYVNLFLTMFLGGIWHGAGWTFVVWGALHGVYLVINHFWKAIWKPAGDGTPWGRAASTLLTFLCVTVGWVFFRAADVDAALVVLKGMAGFNGVVLPYSFKAPLGAAAQALEQLGLTFGWTNIGESAPRLALGLMMVWFLPNTQEWLAKFEPYYGAANAEGVKASRLAWRLTPAFGIALGLTFGVVVSFLAATPASEFLYFDF